MGKTNIDFSRIIINLKNLGLTNKRIAELTGTSPSSIDRIINSDTEPRYSVGAKLIELSKKVIH